MAKNLLVMALLLAIAQSSVGLSQEKKDEKKEPPRILCSAPLAIAPGKPIILQLRGWQLEQAEKLHLLGVAPPLEATIKKKEKSGPPEKFEAKDAGDTLLEAEFKLPDNFSADSVSLVVLSATAVSQPYKLRVILADKLVLEQEPNQSLRKAQAVAAGQFVSGAIQQPRDVDVFEISGKAGQTLVVEVFAAAHGSLLDPLLTIYDSRVQLLATADDAATRDAALTIKLPRDDSYRIVLQDATDRGSPAHSYLLKLTLQ